MLIRLVDKKGFTLVEIMMASVMLAFVAAGLWGIYWSIVDTYAVEQRGENLQAEGERILDLIAHGGYFGGKKIYGLSSSYPESGYPKVGDDASDHFDDEDYKIEFALDGEKIPPGSRRYAAFYVDFDGQGSPTSNFHFKLYAANGNPEDNYNVRITTYMLQRKSGTDSTAYGNYDKTWLKAQRLPYESSSSSYCSGIKISFYMVEDMSQEFLNYNCNLDRKLITPISDPGQKRSLLGGIPYPKFFSTTIYFLNRE